MTEGNSGGRVKRTGRAGGETSLVSQQRAAGWVALRRDALGQWEESFKRKKKKEKGEYEQLCM